MKDFGWFVLVMWVLLAGMAMPLGLGALTQTPLLGLTALIALAGLALAAVFLAWEPTETLAWVMTGLALLGAVVTVGAASWLVADDRPDLIASMQAHEELNAALVGAAIPLFLTTAFAAAVLGLILDQPFGG